MRTRIAFVALFLATWTVVPARADDYWPQGREWETITADDAGAYAKKLQAAVDRAMANNSLSIVVLKNGRILVESYSPDWSRDRRHEIFSAAKSVVALVVGKALEERRIKSLDQSASDFITVWKGTEKEKITVRHLLSMTSGLRQRGLAVRNVQGDQFALNAAAPLDHDPGKFWEYNTAAYHLTFHLVAKATNESFESYAQRKLIGPLGMEDWSWVTNQGKGVKPVTNYYSAECTARDMARIGLLMLRKGQWNGRQLVSARFVRQATSPSQELNPSYGLLWWINGKSGRGSTATRGAAAGPAPAGGVRFPDVPADAFAALGYDGQDILVVPSLDLVVVRQGTATREPNLTASLLKQFVDAIKPAPTLESPVSIR